MDTQRWILFVIFAFSGLMLWNAWQAQFHPVAVPSATRPAAGTPAAPAPATSSADVTKAQGSVPAASAAPAAAGQRLEVRTDLYTATVNTAGGTIEDIALLRHASIEDPAKPYHVLLHTPDRTFLAESGVIGGPTHQTVYEVLPGPRELAPGQDRLDIRLQATTPKGDKVVQTLTFHRGSYVIDVTYAITNNEAAPIAPDAYFHFTRDTKHQGSQSSMAPAAYVGAAIYDDQDKFKKVEFSDIDKHAADPTRKLPYTARTDNGWVGMIEHYFVAAWLPPDKVQREFYTQKLDNGLYRAGVVLPVGTIAPGATGELKVPLYVGPQEQDVLSGLAKGLDLVVDYGIFTVIAAPLFWLLKWLNSVIHNWGWSIIALTILIKSAFYPLNHASARSMAKMKVIAPKMKALQEQYANDKQQLQMKMMEMYRQEKINPLGGCLPIVVQIPVFIALYWVLLSAVELRHAPWIGWIRDLSAPDPWFVLPVVYAVTAYLQVRLSPTPIQDPVQAKVMQIMPVAFSVMFLFFPAGLVLYWLINNCIQIFQQWHMNRVLEKEAAAAAARRR